MYEMKQEYMTGIEIVDEEHAKLFEIANRLYDLLHDEFIADKYDYIIEVVEELKDYSEKHFADEEAYMESINYKKLFTQKIQHAQFMEKVNSFDPEEIDASQIDSCIEILDFITDWLVQHILENDKLIPASC